MKVKTDYIEAWKAQIIEKEHINNLLDKIRAEIADLEEGISSYHNDRPWVFKDEVLQIIDNHIKEQTE